MAALERSGGEAAKSTQWSIELGAVVGRTRRSGRPDPTNRSPVVYHRSGAISQIGRISPDRPDHSFGDCPHLYCLRTLPLQYQRK